MIFHLCLRKSGSECSSRLQLTYNVRPDSKALERKELTTRELSFQMFNWNGSTVQLSEHTYQNQLELETFLVVK